MTSQAQRTQPALRWQMPILPDHYDRSPLSPEEWLALEQYTTIRADSRRGQALQRDNCAQISIGSCNGKFSA